MSRMAEKIAAALAAEVGRRTEWDERPGLYFLYLNGGVPMLREVPTMDRWWAADRPPQVLERMSQITGEMSDVLAAACPEGFHGAAFYSEVWTVKQAPAGTAERSELEADHLAHRRDDRVEARAMYAVDRAGILYAAMQRRDMDTEPKTTVLYPGPARPKDLGTIPVALERIVAAILRVTLP